MARRKALIAPEPAKIETSEPELSRRRQQVFAELERLRQETGRLYAELVVDAARNPVNPMHRLFEWEDAVAAERFRLDQARSIIRIYYTELQVGSRVLEVPTYLSVAPIGDETGYVRSEQIGPKVVVELALRDLKAWQARYAGLLLRVGIVLPADAGAALGIAAPDGGPESAPRGAKSAAAS